VVSQCRVLPSPLHLDPEERGRQCDATVVSQALNCCARYLRGHILYVRHIQYVGFPMVSRPHAMRLQQRLWFSVGEKISSVNTVNNPCTYPPLVCFQIPYFNFVRLHFARFLGSDSSARDQNFVKFGCWWGCYSEVTGRYGSEFVVCGWLSHLPFSFL